ncbi:MAG: glutathione S-transferase N-terminal domain-containing protein [Betaproteobacteria bacterium]
MSKKSLRLIGSLTSPYVRKVRIVMAEKRIDCQLELEDVWAPDSAIQQLNPLGKVPCLIMEDGGALFDSRVIVEYLDTATPVTKLIPANGRERAEVRTWEALGDGIVDAAILVRLEQTQRPPEQQSAKWIERQLGKIHAGLKAASQGLGDKPWCNGQAYSLADIAIGCALGYLAFRFPQIDWRREYPNLAELYDKLAARASFQETVPPGA